MTFDGGFEIVVGVMIAGLWTVLLAARQTPEVDCPGCGESRSAWSNRAGASSRISSSWDRAVHTGTDPDRWLPPEQLSRVPMARERRESLTACGRVLCGALPAGSALVLVGRADTVGQSPRRCVCKGRRRHGGGCWLP